MPSILGPDGHIVDLEAPLFPLPQAPKSYTPPAPSGWVEDKAARDRAIARMERPVFAYCNDAIAGSGKGKVALGYRCLTALAAGKYPVLFQTVGDCVSQSIAGAVDNLRAARILRGGAYEDLTHLTATEPIYGGSRVEIAGNGYGPPFRGDGSNGVWGIEWLQKYGVLLRKPYVVDGQTIDLSTYSGQRARQWGAKGVPNALEPIARQYPVLTASLAQSYEEIRDALANLYFVVVCSSVGFEPKQNTRDKDGFLRPRGRWDHAMLFHAVDDAFRRPGCCCQNSWGMQWVGGPKRHNQPDGSFWVDAEVVDRMAKQGDTWIISDLRGFPRQKFNHVFLAG